MAPSLVRRGNGNGSGGELDGAGSRGSGDRDRHRRVLLGSISLPHLGSLTVLCICAMAAAAATLVLGNNALRWAGHEKGKGAHRPRDLVAPLSAAARLVGIDVMSSSLAAWTTFPAGHDDETARVQAMLNELQNPADCSTRKYFLWSTTKAGMGSALHMIGLVLGWAKEHDRTVLYHPNTAWLYTSRDVCGNVSTPDCFFFPLSRCQYMADRLDAADIFLPPDESISSWRDKQFVHVWHPNNVPQELVPSFSGVPPRNLSWWRAQTTRYIVRPRPRTTELVGRYFASNLLRYPRVPGSNSTTDMPPESGICMHIRHGDMTLHPSVEYMEAADAILRRDAGIGRNIFFSTDNYTVVQEVEGGRYDRYNFTFYYTHYERRSDDMSSMDIARIIGGGEFGVISIANLLLGVHPHCRAFVQTTGSNWNRLINEIRKTDGLRQDAVFVDLEPGEW